MVNNAGVTGFEQGLAAHDPAHASLADWRTVHRVNLDGTPQEVAAIAVMLASDETTYNIVAEVNTDGGLLAGLAATPG